MRISSAPMSIDDVVAVADGASVELAADALDLIATSRRVVDEAIERGDAIYGVTTGVGHARDERLSHGQLRAVQPMLVEMHVGGMGPSLPARRVRAGLVTRLNGLARGGAGASVGLARGLAALLNHGIHPVIPASGSVGAGDLGQLAVVGRALLGRGQVEVGGRHMDASEALTSAGVAPVQLEPKDAIAVMSSNALAVGHAALLLRELEEVIDLADDVAATSMEALPANPSIVHPAVARARASRGQVVTSDRIRDALAGSARIEASGLSVQDPLSFRVVPQVHGACRDVATAARDAVTDELNAPSDNPLVDVASATVISNGNFHPMNVVLAAESLRVALCHVGSLAERRMGHVWERAITAMGMPGGDGEGPPLEGAAPPALAGLGLRYPAAARYTRLRRLAQPVSLDVPSLDMGVEDHAPNTAEALTALEQSIAIVRELLVIELLVAVAKLGPGVAAQELGRGTGALVGVVGETLARLAPGAMPDQVHDDVVHAVVQARSRR